MSEETIPLTFTAVDNLTAAVTNMTKLLEKMGVAQGETTKATEDATKATEKQGEEVQVTSSKWEIIAAKLETAKAAYEFAAGAIGIVSEQITKANEAWDEQSKKLGKSASSLGSIAEANEAATKAQTKFYASIGKVIDRTSIFQALLKLKENTFKSLEKTVKDNEKAIISFVTKGITKGIDGLSSFLELISENSEYIVRLAKYLGVVGDTVALVFPIIKTFGNLWKTVFFTQIAFSITALSKVTEALIAVSEAAGVTVPENIRQISSDIGLAAEDMQKRAAGALNDTIDSGIETIGSIKDTVVSLVDVATGDTKEGEKRIKDFVSNARANLSQLNSDIAKGQTGGGRARTDLGGGELDTTAQDLLDKRLEGLDKVIDKGKEINSQTVDLIAYNRELFASRNASLRSLNEESMTMEIQVAREWEKNEAKAQQLEKDLALYKLQAELAAISDPVVRAETEKVRLAQIEYEEKTKLMALEEERFNLQTESITTLGDLISATFDNVPNLMDSISESTQRMINGFSKAVPKLGELVNSFRAFNKQGATAEDQQEAINAGISAGAGVLSGVTASFIEDKKKQAAIEALINAAAAAASYATGNIPAGIAYTAAAVTYGAAAAFSGGGGGGGGSFSTGGGGGGGGGGFSPSSTNMDDERRANAEAIAEALSAQRENAPLTINLSFDNALIASDSPQAARIISDLVRPELEDIVRNRG